MGDLHDTTTPTATILSHSVFPGVQFSKLGDLLKDKSSLEKTQRETHDLAAEYRWPLPGTGSDRKGACMAHLS